MGIFHPHQEKHHIKKENIGLIEVMGLAVLPSCLYKELQAVADGLIKGEDLTGNPLTASHAEWTKQIQACHSELNRENVMDILQEEVGKVFCAVLEDAGVYKRTPEGKAAFIRFIEKL